jgi:molybdopterin-guanine dinucleotide biosynthesis protein A
MGIFTGLKAADPNRALAVACDMPFVRPALLRHLTIAAPEADVVVPRIDGHLEPLLAVYSKRCLGPIEKMIRHSEKCIYDFFPDVDVQEIQQKELQLLDPGLKSFININSQEELVKITGSL